MLGSIPMSTDQAMMIVRNELDNLDSSSSDPRTELLEKSKLTRKFILDKLYDHMDATQTVLASKDGMFTDSIEIADNRTQVKAAELALRLHRLIDKDAGMSVGAINILWHGPTPRWIPGEADGRQGQRQGQSQSINGENEPIDNGNQLITEGTGEVDLKVLGSDPGVSPPTRSTKSICPPYIPISERSHGVSDKVNVAPPLVKRIKRGK